MLGQVYQNLILYPKGLSQIAKTILSPVTHLEILLVLVRLQQQTVSYHLWLKAKAIKQCISSITNTIKRDKTTKRFV